MNGLACTRLRWPRLAAVAALILALSLAAARSRAEDIPWENMSDYKLMTPRDLTRDLKLAAELFYIDAITSKATSVKLDRMTYSQGKKAEKDEFVCLIAGPDRTALISACRSRTGKFDAANLILDARSLFYFETAVPEAEIDRTKYLKVGYNTFLYDIYRPYHRLDFSEAFLEVQKFGDDDVVVELLSRGNLLKHEILAPDGYKLDSVEFGSQERLGAFIIFETKIRPHLLGVLNAEVLGPDSQTKRISGVILGDGGAPGPCPYNQVITIGPSVVLVVSDKHVLLIDLQRKRFALAKLPAPPRGAAIARIALAQE